MADQQLDPATPNDLITLTRRLRAAERVKYLSSRGVWEYYRMTRTLEAGSPVHLDNNLLPLYSRAIMAEPDLAGVFRTKRLKGPDEDLLGVTDAELDAMQEQAAWTEEDDQ